MNLRTYWNIPHDKRPTQIVERCIGTFKRMLQRYSETKKSLEYTIDLQKIVDEYNNANNQGINTSPVYAMETGTQFSKAGIHRSKQARLKDLYLDVGTKVRKKIKRDTFAKGHHPYYSSRIYEIAERIANNQYRLKDPGTHFVNVEKVPRWYLEELDHEKKTNTHTDPRERAQPQGDAPQQPQIDATMPDGSTVIVQQRIDGNPPSQMVNRLPNKRRKSSVQQARQRISKKTPVKKPPPVVIRPPQSQVVRAPVGLPRPPMRVIQGVRSRSIPRVIAQSVSPSVGAFSHRQYSPPIRVYGKVSTISVRTS
jgi:hypothetical protein